MGRHVRIWGARVVRGHLVGVTLLVLSSLVACSGRPVAPDVRAVRAARRGLASATQSSLEKTRAQAPFVLDMRFNPPSPEGCPCPPFEVRYEGSWHRVVVQTSLEVQQRLDTIIAGGRDIPAGVYVFVGTPGTDVTRLVEGGQLFATFDLVELSAAQEQALEPASDPQ